MTFTCEPFIIAQSDKLAKILFGEAQRHSNVQLGKAHMVSGCIYLGTQRPENIIGNETRSLGIHDANFHKQVGQRHQERTTASDRAAISKTETVLHGISRTFGWIFSGRCFSNSAVHRLPFDWLLNQLFHKVHNLRKGHIRKI